MKNEYEIRGDITAILINSSIHERQEVIIDTLDLKRVQEFPNTWVIGKSPGNHTIQVSGRLDGKMVRLSRWILNLDGTSVTRFNDGNNLNNRRVNLGVHNNSEKGQNRRGPQSNNKSSGIRGVTWDKRTGKWQARFTLHRIVHHVGYFNSLEDAENAVVKARSECMTHSMMDR